MTQQELAPSEMIEECVSYEKRQTLRMHISKLSLLASYAIIDCEFAKNQLNPIPEKDSKKFVRKQIDEINQIKDECQSILKTLK